MSKSFKDLNLIASILEALDNEGYIEPTPIQQEAIPYILSGRDILACAQTGTGKTAAFAIPILQILQNKNQGMVKKPRALILSPTRELVVQIGECFSAYGKYTKCTHTVIYGGVSQKAQVASLNRGVDILIATPGRLKDLLDQGYINLSNIEFLVLDEADRMLDMGFIHDIRFLSSKIPVNKQSVFFTATLNREIKQLADTLLNNPVKVQIAAESSASESIQQLLYFIDKEKKMDLLFELLNGPLISDALIFSKTKHQADRLADKLNRAGIKSNAMHGDKSQGSRQRALENFKAGKIRTLVVTDVAARGIDIESLSHVINYDIPNEPETYVHRIGRTGRAGASGSAISFCCADEINFLKRIHKLIDKSIPIAEGYPIASKGEITSGLKKYISKR
ncbi:DEAD/DEAH box helicase [Sporocytophaga myxococcoides]|uniref:DEAD/DEAH box helicase n=1 Tax=Sporocytophaga myxococcoides TaxID=153721 RepID=UPI000407080A|nr:DEAD/DEAH box helicase [Sporocytophaga myxococcoides]